EADPADAQRVIAAPLESLDDRRAFERARARTDRLAAVEAEREPAAMTAGTRRGRQEAGEECGVYRIGGRSRTVPCLPARRNQRGEVRRAAGGELLDGDVVAERVEHD